ncbi:MAG: glycosyltransferase family 39 protein [Blastocatellia bacterium]|nr:glycosyltransferase family 39 protein [Blastocatellia bacterium]
MQPQKIDERFHIPIILFFSLLLFYFNLGGLAFVGPDEPRYAQVAREMFERRDFVTPTLLGHTWFEKPVLLYWLMMGCYKIFGVNEWAARFPNATLATISLLLVYIVASRAANKSIALWSSLSLATSALYLGLARAASFDMPLTFTFTLALLLFYLADVEEVATKKKLYMSGFYAAVGLALLAKGLVGPVLITAIVLLYLLLSGQIKKGFCYYPFAGSLIVLLVASIWYWPVIAKHQWLFIDEFFIQHHFQRYTSNKYRHPGPIYYFLLIVSAGIFPWTLFLIVQLSTNIKKMLESFRSKPLFGKYETAFDKLQLLAFCWILVPLLFFSFSGSKLPGYILPIFPALGLIVGYKLDQISTTQSNQLVRVTAIFLIIFGGGLGYFAGKELNATPTAQFALLGLSIVIAIGMFIVRLKPLLLFSPLLAVLISLLLFPGIEYDSSIAPLSKRAAIELRPEEEIIFFNSLEYAPFFYTNGRIVKDKDGKEVVAVSRDEIVAHLASRSSLLCIMRSRHLEMLDGDSRFRIEKIDSQRTFVLLRLTSSR